MLAEMILWRSPQTRRWSEAEDIECDFSWNEKHANTVHVMTTPKQQARHEFWRMVKWIAVAGVVMVIGALVYLQLMGAWSFHAAVATVFGVFISVLLGCGLFALAFFSDKSGHDEDVTNTRTKQND